MTKKLSSKKLDMLLSQNSRHQEFSVRSHLMRWFHEQNTNSLKAMKAGYLKAQEARGVKL
jgi:hypothetical protein